MDQKGQVGPKGRITYAYRTETKEFEQRPWFTDGSVSCYSMIVSKNETN